MYHWPLGELKDLLAMNDRCGSKARRRGIGMTNWVERSVQLRAKHGTATGAQLNSILGTSCGNHFAPDRQLQLDKLVSITNRGVRRGVVKKQNPQSLELCGFRDGRLAERVGFEPTVPCSTPDFESGTFDHSATSPKRPR